MRKATCLNLSVNLPINNIFLLSPNEKKFSLDTQSAGFQRRRVKIIAGAPEKREEKKLKRIEKCENHNNLITIFFRGNILVSQFRLILQMSN